MRRDGEDQTVFRAVGPLVHRGVNRYTAHRLTVTPDGVTIDLVVVAKTRKSGLSQRIAANGGGLRTINVVDFPAWAALVEWAALYCGVVSPHNCDEMEDFFQPPNRVEWERRR